MPVNPFYHMRSAKAVKLVKIFLHPALLDVNLFPRDKKNVAVREYWVQYLYTITIYGTVMPVFRIVKKKPLRLRNTVIILFLTFNL